MINVYVTMISDYSKIDIEDKISKLLKEETLEKGKRFIYFDDTKRTLVGEAMARYAISVELNISNKNIAFKRNEYGKPLLLNQEGIHFNISHSGDYVVCAIGTEAVGIDIEHIKDIDFDVGKRFFSKEEFESLSGQDEDIKLRYFYRIWTLKESYMKLHGKGLSISPNTFSIEILNNKYELIYSLENMNCFFREYDIDSEYVLSASSLEKDFCKEVKVVRPEDIFKKMLEVI